MSKIIETGAAMNTTHTPPPKEQLQPGEAYKLPEAQRQAILQGSDFARTRALIHAQREKFLARIDILPLQIA